VICVCSKSGKCHTNKNL